MSVSLERVRAVRRVRAVAGVACAVAAVTAGVLVAPSSATADARPVVTGLSVHKGAYWGDTLVTVRGSGFVGVTKVVFGSAAAWAVTVKSPTQIILRTPWHGYAKVNVRVVAAGGSSAKTKADLFSFVAPTMNTPIQGGLTARQEQKISASVRKHHKNAHTARKAGKWTAAMGVTALNRAKSWIGLPYSWAGGNTSGPTTGVCAHNGGDLDCHVVGFDCSGLALYSWGPYKHLVHYAATQHGQAGKFHPSRGQLVPGDLVFFSGYISDGIGHVAVYAGNGWVIQAPESGSTVVRSRLTDVIAASGVYRGATRPMSTGRQGAVPRVSSMTSQITTKGARVTIHGSALSNATSVVVGGTTLYSFAKRSSTQLVVNAPAHKAGKVTVSVSNPWGSAKKTLTYVAAPKLSSVTPNQGMTDGGNQVVLTGSSLSAVTRVTVGGTSAAFTIANSGKLTVTVPAHAAGTVAVIAQSPFGTSNAEPYTYVSAAPPTQTAQPTQTAPPAPTTTAPVHH
jgi:cell wall-associated NlpC family hydrolase